MTDQTDPPQPPPEPPPASSFPESSLGQPPEPPPLPPAAPEAAPPAWEQPAPPPAEGGLWAGEQAAPPPAPVAPAPSPTGLSSGDPLGGAFPQGYTTAPPPGAGGLPPVAGLGSDQQAGGLPGQFVLSGWWRRVGAALIDGLIVSMVAFAIMAAIGVGFVGSDFNSDAEIGALVGSLLVGVLVFAIVVLAYAPVMMGATNGKTLGRMATGIRVVRANGRPISFGFAALREVLVKQIGIWGVASSFTFGLAYLLDVLWPLWDDENRALHDFIVDTRTIRD